MMTVIDIASNSKSDSVVRHVQVSALSDNRLVFLSVKTMARPAVADRCVVALVEDVAAALVAHPMDAAAVALVAEALVVMVADFEAAIKSRKLTHSIIVTSFSWFFLRVCVYVRVCACIYQYREQQTAELGFFPRFLS
jgi:hypothetical protein